MKKVIIGIVVLVLVGLGVNFIKNNKQAAEETGPVKIGWIGPITGQSAVLGMDSIVAAQIAVDEINKNGGIDGRAVELIAEDDQYNITKSLSAYQKLTQVDGVKIIIANTYGSIFVIADQAQEDGVLIIDPLDCNSVLAELGDHVFCLATDSESIGHVLADHAIAAGNKKVGIIHWNSDAFLPLVKDVLVKDFAAAKVETLVEGYSAGTQDFRSVILKMKQAGVESLVLLGYDETGNAMQQAREIGFTGQFYTTGTVTSPSLQKAAAGHAEGTILAFWNAPKEGELAQKFITAFTTKQNRPPILDLASYPTYDTINVLAKAIGDAGSTNPAKVGESLLKIKNYQGVTGTISFAADGSVRIPESAYVLENGQVKEIGQ